MAFSRNAHQQARDICLVCCFSVACACAQGLHVVVVGGGKAAVDTAQVRRWRLHPKAAPPILL